MMPSATFLAPGSRKLSMKRPLLRANRPACASFRSKDGQFVSLLDPPEQFQEAGTACHSAGAWPVPIGGVGQRESAPSSPIILGQKFTAPCGGGSGKPLILHGAENETRPSGSGPAVKCVLGAAA